MDSNEAEPERHSLTPTNHQNEDGAEEEVRVRPSSGDQQKGEEEIVDDAGRRTQLVGEAEEVEPVDQNSQGRADSQLEGGGEDTNWREPQAEYEEESQSLGMAEAGNPVSMENDHVDTEPINGADRNEERGDTESSKQETLVLDSEPRVTHTGSKALHEMRSDGFFQRSIEGFDWEAVRSIFNLFQSEEGVKISELGELLRCLNMNPTEAEVADVAKQLSHGTSIAWDTFLSKVTEFMQAGKYQPAAEEELLAAFCALDPQLSGMISAQQLREALTGFGEPLTDEEFEDLITFAPKDPNNGLINYKEYAKELCAR